jgi:hypothetical protein
MYARRSGKVLALCRHDGGPVHGRDSVSTDIPLRNPALPRFWSVAMCCGRPAWLPPPWFDWWYDCRLALRNSLIS